jgi:uncharacterized membrane protein YkvA (DUF1232 family)
LVGRLRFVPSAQNRHGGAYYLDWSSEFVRREPATLARARRDLAELIEQVRFAQFLLFRQGKRLAETGFAAGYLLKRFDLIPDHVAEIGLADDALIPQRVVRRNQSELIAGKPNVSRRR